MIQRSGFKFKANTRGSNRGGYRFSEPTLVAEEDSISQRKRGVYDDLREERICIAITLRLCCPRLGPRPRPKGLVGHMIVRLVARSTSWIGIGLPVARRRRLKR